MIKIIKSCNIYAPEPIGVKDILIFGSQIVLLADAIDPPFAGQVPAEVVNAHGLLAFPGFIDGHVHLAGGGGEGGFHTRTPEIALSSLVRGGITSVIGCLGTDSLTRSLEGLYAKAKGLEAEGITARILTGSYRVPIVTLTGDPMKDLVLIDLVVGAGEIALSDHRSAQPTLEELRRLAADIRVGAILSGKAGVINLHLGDGPGGLGLLREIIATTEIPRSQFLPTHINRNERLLDARHQVCPGRRIHRSHRRPRTQAGSRRHQRLRRAGALPGTRSAGGTDRALLRRSRQPAGLRPERAVGAAGRGLSGLAVPGNPGRPWWTWASPWQPPSR